MNHGASKVPSKNMKLLFSSHPQISCFKLLEYSLGKMFSFFFFQIVAIQASMGTWHKASRKPRSDSSFGNVPQHRGACKE